MESEFLVEMLTPPSHLALPIIQDQYSLIKLLVENQTNAEKGLEKVQIALDGTTLGSEGSNQKQNTEEPLHAINAKAEETRGS